MSITIRSGLLSDIDDILKLAIEFFYESEFRYLTLDAPLYKNCLLQSLTDPHSDVITAWDGGKIIGYAIIFCTREYTRENIGEMYQFYIRPEYRGSGVSRNLVKAMEYRFSDWNCALSYVSADPRIDFKNNNKLFSNLFSKFDYKDSGIVMIKERHG